VDIGSLILLITTTAITSLKRRGALLFGIPPYLRSHPVLQNWSLPWSKGVHVMIIFARILRVFFFHMPLMMMVVVVVITREVEVL